VAQDDDDGVTPVWRLSPAQLRAELDRSAASVVGYLVDQERRCRYATADGAASVRRHLELRDELARRSREELHSGRGEPAVGAKPASLRLRLCHDRGVSSDAAAPSP
jgi:hypothetical protein